MFAQNAAGVVRSAIETTVLPFSIYVLCDRLSVCLYLSVNRHKNGEAVNSRRLISLRGCKVNDQVLAVPVVLDQDEDRYEW